MYIICGMILDVSHALQCMMQGHAVEIHTYMVSQEISGGMLPWGKFEILCYVYLRPLKAGPSL